MAHPADQKASTTVSKVLAGKPQPIPRYGTRGYDQARAEASIRALRDMGRYGALLSDTGDVGVRGAFSLSDGSMGVYVPDADHVTLYGEAGQIGPRHQKYGPTSSSDLKVAGAHELTHGLQNELRRHSSYVNRRDPYDLLRYVRADAGLWDRIKKDYRVNGEDVSAFYDLLKNSKTNYSENEMGARFASELGYGPNIISPIVREAYTKYPGTSMVYAQRNMQPNRPVPQHFKGEPEWTSTERKTFEKTGERPVWGVTDMIRMQSQAIRDRWARGQGTEMLPDNPPPQEDGPIEQIRRQAYDRFNRFMR